MAKDKLQIRKQQLVRDAIYETAIERFAAKGFDETTIEEIAQAAGISRRSFFRYYAAKDELLSQSVVNYGVTLTAAIAASPASLTPLEVVRDTVLSGVKYVAAQPLTRQIIEISERSASARQAHASRLMEVEDRVSTAYAQRFKKASKYDMKPRLLAGLTISLLNVALISWYRGEYEDIAISANQAFLSVACLICDPRSAQPKQAAITGRRSANPSALGKFAR